MNGDGPTKEVLQLLEKACQAVLGRKQSSNWIYYSLIPLIGWPFPKLTGVEKLGFGVGIGMLIPDEKMKKFHFESRKDEGGAREWRRRGQIQIRMKQRLEGWLWNILYMVEGIAHVCNGLY